LDDFYKTKLERQAMAESTHPLFQTRGAPGTHDLKLALKTLKACLERDRSEPIQSPRFRKEIDDRASPREWKRIQPPVDIILFEGWCVSARPQSEKDLVNPINSLENDSDTEGLWRRQVNDYLANTYAELFSFLDHTIMLKVPDFEHIIEWRLEQEDKLREASQSLKDAPKHQFMTRESLKDFIAHYERLTRWMLQTMPSYADIILSFNADRSLKSLVLKNV
jgi:D-glycerate 3-kinase